MKGTLGDRLFVALRRIDRRRWAITLGAPFAAYLLGVLLLGDWIIDDAGISFAYARSVATGHGFVAQPGRAPVEGFSDFLWVILLVPTFVLRVFHPILTPKILGALLVLASFAAIQRAIDREASARPARVDPRIVGVAACVLVGASPPIAIWTASGLENGLTLLLAAAMFERTSTRPRGWAAHLGILAALLAMTHPEGLVFVAAGPLFALADAISAAGALRRKKAVGAGTDNGGPWRSIGVDLARFGAAFAALFGPFLAFRLAIFGLPLPHTYYAKRMHVSPWDRLAEMGRDPGAVVAELAALLRGIFGPPGLLLAALAIVTAVWLASGERLPRTARTALLLAGIAVSGYLFIDEDWMGEFRFATAAALFATLSLVTTLAEAIPASWGGGEGARRRAGIATGLLCAAALGASLPRTIAFASKPPAPFLDMDRSHAKKLAAYADDLGIRGASALLPDVGAPLFDGRLRVIDLAGLCEPEIVRTLKEGRNVWLDRHPLFYDWVFERARPTFVTTHHFWTLVSALELDPRFERDYVAIDAYEDAYVLRVFGRSLRSGDFVRRDALPEFARLHGLHDRTAPAPRPDPWVVRFGEWLSGTPRLDTDAAITAVRERAEEALTVNDDPDRAATLLARVLAARPSDLGAAHLRAMALDAAARPNEAHVEWLRVLDLGLGTAYADAARERLFPPPRKR